MRTEGPDATSMISERKDEEEERQLLSQAEVN